MNSSGEETKNLIVLYADWNDSTVLPENFNAALETALSGLTVSRGRLASRSSHSFTAVWGSQEAAEDDANWAIRFALELRDSIRTLPGDRGSSDSVSPIRIAIAAGQTASIQPPAKMPEYLAGEAPEFCRRMLAIFQKGDAAVSQEVYQRVEGIFTFTPLAQLPRWSLSTGSDQPVAVEIYRLIRAKPLQFRILPTGIEGISTRLIGREIEFKRLLDAYEIATDEHENQLVLVVGEAGMGKTRLLVEAERRRDLISESTRLFRAQATPEMLQQPYGLLRKLFMNRFGIQEGDSEANAYRKFQIGVEQFMETDKAVKLFKAGAKTTIPVSEHTRLLARLIGLLGSEEPDPADTVSAALFEQQALQSLAGFFQAVDVATSRGVIALHLEDMQWADDKSLDALLWLIQQRRRGRIVAVVLARPELFERRPRWGIGLANSIRIDLYALPERDARKLVREILQRLPTIPDRLRDWIVGRSSGNPLHIEELVRALISGGVIQRSENQTTWDVDLTYLDIVPIPDSLAGLLEAQLASLPEHQQIALQRAAVIGRFFWDSGVAALEPADGKSFPTIQALGALVRRSLLYRPDPASYARLQEYAFLNNQMYETVYRSIPPALQRRYHLLAGEWLSGLSGKPRAPKAASLASRIAIHFEAAGEEARAIPYLMVAAEEARRHNDFEQARRFLLRAVNAAESLVSSADVVPSPNKREDSMPKPAGFTRTELLYRLGEILIWQGEAAQAIPYLEASLALARQAGDERVLADVLGRLGWAAYYSGDLSRARAWLEEGAACSRRSGNRSALLLALRQLGNIVSAEGDYPGSLLYYQESLGIAREIHDPASITAALNNLGLTSILTGDYEQAHKRLLEAIFEAEQHGNRMGAALATGNKGMGEYLSGQPQAARVSLQQAINISRSAGSQLLPAEALVWRALAEAACGEMSQAESSLAEGLGVSLDTGQFPLALGALVGFAALAEQQGNGERAVELMALVSENPALDDLIRPLVASPLLERLARELPPQTFGRAWARGQALDLDTTFQSFRDAPAQA